MKPTLIYAGLSLASLLVAAEIVLLVVPHGSEQPGPKTESRAALGTPRDSLVAKADSVAPMHDSLAITSKDTLKNAGVTKTQGLRDTLELLMTQLAAERKKVSLLSVQTKPDTARPDTATSRQMKVVAKLLEAMDAQGAAKILHQLDDKEVKEILFAVKKRQAGKILSSLDPERAARIIR